MVELNEWSALQDDLASVILPEGQDVIVWKLFIFEPGFLPFH
jgi:hypothetical protein